MILIRFWSFFVLNFLRLNIKLENGERFQGLRSSIIIANHQENLDAFIFGKVLPDRVITIGKKELLFYPFFGILYWLAGNIFIDRSNRIRAFKSLERAKGVLERGTNIVIMPEGVRSRGSGLKKFKRGAFHLAIQAQAPIYPLVVNDYSHLDWNAWSMGTIRVSVLEPIETVGMGGDQVSHLRDVVESKVREQLAQM